MYICYCCGADYDVLVHTCPNCGCRGTVIKDEYINLVWKRKS